MKQLPVKHHSIADWDFEAGIVKELDASYYTSAPTSLHLGHYPNGTPQGAILCRVATTLNLPQGRVVTACRQRAQLNMYRIIFRNQAALGTADRLNCYEIWQDYEHWYLHRIIASDDTILATRDGNFYHDIWETIRVTWWNGTTPEEEEALCVTLEEYEDGEWVKKGDTAYDTENHWKDSEINRCGLGAAPGLLSGWEQWYDDTEIWGPE